MFSLNDFVDANLGKPNVGDTAINKGQCVGLVEAWLDANGKPHVWGDARELLDNADLRYYLVTRNTPDNYPPAGAIVCWDSTWGAGHGHTALVLFANSKWLVVLEQNNPEGHPPVVATHGYAGVVGWFTFR